MNDSKRLWAAVAGLIATLALLVRIGGIAVSDLASGEKLGAKTAYCKTGRYGPGPCIKGSLVDVIASSVISVILLLIIVVCLRVIWKSLRDRQRPPTPQPPPGSGDA